MIPKSHSARRKSVTSSKSTVKNTKSRSLKSSKTPKSSSRSSKQSVSKLKIKADREWSLYVRYRDAQYLRGEWMCECITCGDSKPVSQMQCGHFVSRRVSLLRFDERNTNGQCVGCNMFKQGEQYLYGLAVDRKYGDGTAAELMAQRNSTHKFTITELEAIIEYAREGVKTKLSTILT